LRYPKAEKSIFLKTLSTRLFLSNGFRFNKNNTLFINVIPEENILNDIGNVVFLKSWKHSVKPSSTIAYLSRKLGPWLEKLYKEG
jgi:hypothetical protein